jgi:hypothetical protein
MREDEVSQVKRIAPSEAKNTTQRTAVGPSE